MMRTSILYGMSLCLVWFATGYAAEPELDALVFRDGAIADGRSYLRLEVVGFDVVDKLILEAYGRIDIKPDALTYPIVIPDDHPRLTQFIKHGIVTRAPARSWGCEQAAGPPDTLGAGDIVTAWASATQDGQDEWLELTYEKAVKPVEVHVVETYNPGALFKVTAMTESGMEAVLWKGQDPTAKDAALKYIDELEAVIERLKGK